MKRARLTALVTACWLMAVQTAFATADDFALAIDELAQQFQILVVDVHRTRTFAVNKDGVFFLGAHFHAV